MGRHAKGRAGRAVHLRWVASSRAPCLVSWLSFLVLVFIPLCSQELVFCGSVWSMHLYCARCVVRAPFSCYERERERERCSVSVGGAGSSQPTMCASAFERRAPTFTKQKSPAFFLSSALFRVKRSSWPISAPPPRLRNSPLVFSIISETAVCLIAHLENFKTNEVLQGHRLRLRAPARRRRRRPRCVARFPGTATSFFFDSLFAKSPKHRRLTNERSTDTASITPSPPSVQSCRSSPRRG